MTNFAVGVSSFQYIATYWLRNWVAIGIVIAGFGCFCVVLCLLCKRPQSWESCSIFDKVRRLKSIVRKPEDTSEP